MLEMDQVTVHLNNRMVLRKVSLKLGSGLTMLLGENGAGKTTLLRTLMGFCKTEEGQICYGGKLLQQYTQKQRAAMVAYVPQLYGEGGRYSVREFVAMGANPYLGVIQMPGHRVYQRVDAILQELKLSHLSCRFLDQVSGGERRMVSIARAVMQQAQWMLLDEPAAHLDVGKQHQLLKQLKNVEEGKCRGILMSIHDPMLACCYADRILLMKGGAICGDINREDLDFEPQMIKGLRELYGGNWEFVCTQGAKRVPLWSE